MNKHLILYNFLLGTEITPQDGTHYKFEIYSSNSNVKYITYLKFFTSSEGHVCSLLTFEYKNIRMNYEKNKNS